MQSLAEVQHKISSLAHRKLALYQQRCENGPLRHINTEEFRAMVSAIQVELNYLWEQKAELLLHRKYLREKRGWRED